MAAVLRWTRQLGLWAALLLTGISLADDPPQSAAPSGTLEKAQGAGSSSAPAAAPPNVPTDLLYLLGDDGRPIYVVDNVTFRQFLDFRNAQREQPQNPVEFSVTSISCTGALQEDMLQLKVTFSIQIFSDQWVKVPLKMAEATLRDTPTYAGPGEVYLSPMLQPETGHTLWVRGKTGKADEHKFTMSLLIHVRKQPPDRRIQLSLPAAAVSSFKLHVPHTRVIARGADRSIVTVRSEGRASEIEVIGLGERLDLKWQVLPEATTVETALEVQSSITATLAEAEKTATFEAIQTLQSIQGTFDAVRVTLPPGAEFRVDGPEFKDHQVDAAHPNQVVVKLKEPTIGPVRLRWTVRTPLSAAGEPFVIEGFDVDRARIHTGNLAVAFAGDFRLVEPAEPPSDRSATRINVTELPSLLRQSRIRAAYSFSNRLRLKLLLQRVAPHVTARADAWLRIEPLSAQFAAEYAFQISRGSISELSFRWRAWSEQGWEVTSVEATDDLVPEISDESQTSDRLRVALGRPVQKRFRLTIHARRVLTNGETIVPVSLPVSETASGTPTHLAVLTPENLDVDLQPVAGTVALRQTDAPSRLAVPREMQSLRRDDLRLESAEADFLATLTAHPREVQASTNVSASQAPGMVVVRQRIQYNVLHGSLAGLRFEVPRGENVGQLRISEVDGTRIDSRAVTEENAGVLSLPFDAPRSGRFELELNFAVARESIPVAANNEQSLTIPLILSADAGFSSTQFEWHDSEGRTPAVQGEDWTRTPNPDGTWSWTSPRAIREIEIALAHGGSAWSAIAVKHALIRSRIGPDGTILTRAEYRMTAPAIDLTTGFPPNVQLLGVWWDDQLLKLPPAQADAQGVVRYQLAADRGVGAEPLLTIETKTDGAGLSRFADSAVLTAPQLPASLPVLKCDWLVTLPPLQLLMTEPAGFVPEFHWRRSGFFWSRQSRRTSEELEVQIGSRVPRSSLAESDAGNAYLFSRAGAAERLSLHVMRLPGVVLIGASVALFAGWVLVKWPATHHVVTLLVAGFILSTAAVWFAGPVLVLLQPAALGLLLAVMATLIDRYLRRKSPAVSVALNPTSGFAHPSSSPRAPVVTIGANEHAYGRGSSAPVATPPEQLTETGSRT